MFLNKRIVYRYPYRIELEEAHSEDPLVMVEDALTQQP